jgi:2'-5' RNA ligase
MQIKKFSEFLNEKKEQKFDYGCSMVYFNFPVMNRVQSLIEEGDLYKEEGDRGYGREEEPHTTLLYGIHSDECDDDEIMEASVLEPNRPIKLFDPSLFENEKYDVLKFNADGDGLHEANAKLRKFPHTNEYEEYVPHATIAYLKKGLGKKYIAKIKEYGLDSHEVKPLKIVYSKPDGKKVEKDL